MDRRDDDGGAATATWVWPAPRATLIALLAVSAFFFACTLVRQSILTPDDAPSILSRFDATDEGNLAVWFSSLLLLLCGASALAIGAARRRQRRPFAHYWLAGGALATLMSADETGQLHEQTVHPVMEFVQEQLGIGGSAAKAVAAGLALVFVAVLAAGAIPWLRSLPRPALAGLCAGAGVYLAGALGLEIVSRLGETLGLGGIERWLPPFEELLEMAGASLAIVALLPLLPGTAPASAATAAEPAHERVLV